MAEKYDQQDGSPNPRPDSGETVLDPNDAHPAVVGERSTQENIGGQGLGQYKGDEGQLDGALPERRSGK
jgi:hypothetical protein